MTTSEAGLALLKEFEGLSLITYNDVAGKPTIGYGHLLKPGEDFPLGISKEQAVMMLAVDVETVEDWLTVHLVDIEYTQGQFDALVDFGFNLGIGALKQMLAHGWNEIPVQILRWDKARVGGVLQPVKGLTRRRESERDLFLA